MRKGYFHLTLSQIADTVAIRIDNSPNGAVEEDVQWWANRWRYVL